MFHTFKNYVENVGVNVSNPQGKQIDHSLKDDRESNTCGYDLMHQHEVKIDKILKIVKMLKINTIFNLMIYHNCYDLTICVYTY